MRLDIERGYYIHCNEGNGFCYQDNIKYRYICSVQRKISSFSSCLGGDPAGHFEAYSRRQTDSWEIHDLHPTPRTTDGMVLNTLYIRSATVSRDTLMVPPPTGLTGESHSFGGFGSPQTNIWYQLFKLYDSRE